MNAKQFISERIAPKTIKDDMHFMCTVSELLSLLDDYAAQCVAELTTPAPEGSGEKGENK